MNALYSTGPALFVIGVRDRDEVSTIRAVGQNTATLASPGSGYVQGVILTIFGGTGNPMQILVTAVDGGGGIVSFEIFDPGSYTVPPPNPAPAFAPPAENRGIGATFRVTINPAITVQQTTTLVRPLALGTCESAPLIEFSPEFVPLDADEGGGLPADRIYVGKEAKVVGVLNRLNLPLMTLLMNSPASPTKVEAFTDLDIDQANGWDNEDAIGVIMGREGATYDLWVLFPRQLLPDMQRVGLIPGYHFLSVYLAKASIIPGSGDLKIAAVFQCQRKRVITASVPSVIPIGSDTATLADGGNGYTLGEILTTAGVIGAPMIFGVTSVSNDEDKEITGFSILDKGNITQSPGNPVSVTSNLGAAGGSGAKFNLFFNTQTTVPTRTNYVLYDHRGLNGDTDMLRILDLIDLTSGPQI